MSKQRNRNSLLTSQSRPTPSNNLKDELLLMKYDMIKPDVPIYPIDDNALSLSNLLDEANRNGPIYPDYIPWKDHTKLPEEEVEKQSSTAYLNKGYFESPAVTNEYYSARNIVQATIFSSVDNCNTVLQELSLHLTNAYKTRNEVINKIKFDSNSFRIPPRVTLTSSKKEAWLQDLANPNIPLQKVGEKFPHGIRNKLIIDAVCNKLVPINRALWFTKCLLYGELFTLKKKYLVRTQVGSPQVSSPQVNTPLLDKVEQQWFQEWTQQVVDYIYKFSKEMSSIDSIERKLQYMTKLNYLLRYVQSLYVEKLLDKNYFLSLVLKLFEEGLLLEVHQISHIVAVLKFDEDESSFESIFQDLKLDLGQRLVALTLVKEFWNDILSLNHLCKELSEKLLLNYFFIQKKSQIHDVPENLKSLECNLLEQISSSITYLFKANTDVFIIPNYWALISETLYELLLNDKAVFEEGEKEELLNQLEFIKYRNESLMLNLKEFIPTENSVEQTQLESEFVTITRSPNDILKFVHQLDNLRLNEEFANSLKPSTELNGSNWRIHLKLVFIWCVTSLSNKHSTESILIICNFIKKRVVQRVSSKDGSLKKIEFETEVLEILYNIAENYNSKIIDHNLYVLINELYQLKMLTISAYLRKLIASGIFHISEKSESLDYNSSVKIHLAILQNLPIINNKQCNNILQSWRPNTSSFKERFDLGKEVLKREFLDKVLHNSFEGDFEVKVNSIRKLDVGIKFLLVNWLTNEFKSAISASPKLIHINPTIITNFYYLFLWCDNLTVFFKDIIKFLLKNDGGIIIIYLDSLYLISKLVMKHFKLIKFIAGSVSEIATGYELFNLIILTYKDLVTREFDYFKFQQIWTFIDISIEKTTPPKTTEPKKVLPIFAKDTMESPMKINTHDVHISTRSSERLPFMEFHQNLLDVKSFANPNMEHFEALELQIKLGLRSEDVESRDILKILLGRLILVEKDEEENSIIKLLVSYNLSSQTLALYLLKESIRDLVEGYFKGHHESAKFKLFMKNLVIYELLPFSELILMLKTDFFNESGSSDLLTSLVLQANDELGIIPSPRLVLLSINRENYRRHDFANFSTLVQRALQSPLVESPLYAKYSYSLTEALEHIIISNTRIVYGDLFSNLTTSDVIDMTHDFLAIPTNKRVHNLEDFKNISNQIDEINITMFQLLLRALAIQDLTGLDVDLQRQKLQTTIIDSIQTMRFEFLQSNSYFGELFACLIWDHKILVLDVLETLFLQSTTFQLSNPMNITLQLSSTGINLLPILDDFFKKFLASSTCKVETQSDIFKNVCGFLVQLIELVNKDLNDENLEDNLRNGISIFLRILIIHKLKLTEFMLGQSAELMAFLKNLIVLLQCEFLTQKNEKLKILLHDLLLLIKSSITQEVSLLNENVNSIRTQDSSQHEKNGASAITPALSSELSSIFNFSESAHGNPLGKYNDSAGIDCCITLEDEELNKGADIHYFNDANLILMPSKNDSLTLENPFGLLSDGNTINNESNKTMPRPFKLKSFEVFEETSFDINNGCLNLQFFDAYTTRENPP